MQCIKTPGGWKQSKDVFGGVVGGEFPNKKLSIYKQAREHWLAIHMDGARVLPQEGYLRKVVIDALDRLRNQYELVILRGTGNAAELNLRVSDIVNVAVARYTDAPVLLPATLTGFGREPRENSRPGIREPVTFPQYPGCSLWCLRYLSSGRAPDNSPLNDACHRLELNLPI